MLRLPYHVISLIATCWHRRELISVLISRDLKARYRGSVLGFLWSFLNPLLMMAVYTFVFQFAMRFEWNDPRPYAMFLLTGLLPWTWFASSMGEGSMSIISGGAMVKNIRFPAEVLPLATVLANLVHFLIGLSLLAVFMLAVGMTPSLHWLALPAVMALQFLLTFGLTLAVAALSVFFRDISQLLINLLLIWFFLSPVLYTPEMVARLPERLLQVWRLNPFAGILEAYHAMLFYNRWPSIESLALPVAVSLTVFLLGIAVFSSLRDYLAEGI